MNPRPAVISDMHRRRLSSYLSHECVAHSGMDSRREVTNTQCNNPRLVTSQDISLWHPW